MSASKPLLLVRAFRSQHGRLRRGFSSTTKCLQANTESIQEQEQSRSSIEPSRIIAATNTPVSDSSRFFSSLASNTQISTATATENKKGTDELRNSHSDTDTSKSSVDDFEISIDDIRALASQPCTPLSLSDMFKYASANANSKNYGPQRLRNAQFLHKELPIRVAQRAIDLLTLPHGLNKTPQVQEIALYYINYLKNLQNFPVPKDAKDELEFTDMLRFIIQDRASIPMAIAKGVATLKDHRKEELDIQRLQEMEKALYRFFNARTGLRLLTEHHILSCTERRHENEELRKMQSVLDNVSLDGESSSFLGCIQIDCDPFTETKRVADQVMKRCKSCYGVSPQIEVLNCTPERYSDSNFTYVPHHLQYTLAELLKNSCRATIQRHLDGVYYTEDHIGSHHDEEGVAEDKSLPSIRVVIAKGAEDVTIKIADRGGGVPRSVIGDMWTFAHTSLSDELHAKESDTVSESDEFSGSNIRGFGLPLARIYARYFGGELTLKSMEGYGVDAYLYLPVLGDACENLPERVQKSPANHDSVHDGNHHAYHGDSFSSTDLSAEEPWGVGIRHFSSLSFKKLGRTIS
mmetsp:Transcript_16721/g.24510  ORF Transcript_16721/g.24510 Transcript_16721/m.24510 type:complete len:578 (+) Transcript_16721:109-1842(+)